PAQLAEALVPLGAHPRDPLRGILERRRVEPVARLAADSLGPHQVRAAKRCQVLGDTLAADRQLRGEGAGGYRGPSRERLDEAAAGGVGERREDRIDASGSHGGSARPRPARAPLRTRAVAPPTAGLRWRPARGRARRRSAGCARPWARG